MLANRVTDFVLGTYFHGFPLIFIYYLEDRQVGGRRSEVYMYVYISIFIYLFIYLLLFA